MDQSKVFFQGEEVSSNGGQMSSWIKPTYEEEVANMGEAKGGNHEFRRRPSQLDGGKYPSKCKRFEFGKFLQFYACFDYVVTNHQKGEDCNEYGPI